MKDLLKINQLKVQFPTKEGMIKAVDGVNLTIRQGEVLGLIGESGSGKSVLALSMLQFLPKSTYIQGNVMFEGTNLLDCSHAEMRTIRGSRIGLIPQNPSSSLNPVLRIGMQVGEAIGRHRKLSSNKIKALSLQLLERMGFPDARRNVSSYPFQLSGGMIQRVLASIGIAGEPELIIADEPTKGLDALTRNKVTELMNDIVRETGATLLLITHDLHVARKICDRIGVMYAGHLIELRETEPLFVDPKHPYTEALLESLPERGLKPVPGLSPSLADDTGGCKFYRRCSVAKARCLEQPPRELTVKEDGGMVRCFLYDS